MNGHLGVEPFMQWNQQFPNGLPIEFIKSVASCEI